MTTIILKLILRDKTISVGRREFKYKVNKIYNQTIYTHTERERERERERNRDQEKRVKKFL